MFAVSGAPVMFFKEQSPGDFLRAALLDDSGLWLLGRPWCWDVLRKLESTHQCTPKIVWLAASFPSKNYAQKYWIERHFFLMFDGSICINLDVDQTPKMWGLHQRIFPKPLPIRVIAAPQDLRHGWGLAGIFLLGYDLSQFSNSAAHWLPSGNLLQFANWKMAIQIVDLPSWKMVDLSIVM